MEPALRQTYSVFERKLIRLSRSDAFFEVSPADGHVSLVAADLDLRSVADRLTVFTKPQHHRRFAAAVTDRLDLGQAVGPGKQVLTAFEEVTLEVGSQSVSEDWNIKIVNNVAELSNLLPCQELCLVDKDAMHRLLLVRFTDSFEEVVRRNERRRLCLQPDP